MPATTAEQQRLNDNALKEVPLENWGPYLSERQWGTVREDYSPNGDVWDYFTHDQSRSRAYRWGEDGLAGISDMHQNLCLSFAFWNGKDSILKERLFGLSNKEGNHGEDVKELYYYLDNLPTHSYMEYLYKYPQQAFPYDQLLQENFNRSKTKGEVELLDTDALKDDRYFDVHVTYAKAAANDICIKVHIENKGPEKSKLWLLPTLWFRNRWAIGDTMRRPFMERSQTLSPPVVHAGHDRLGDYYFYFPPTDLMLMTENESNKERLFNYPNGSPFVKDAFHDAIAGGNHSLLEQLRHQKVGSKFSPVYQLTLEGGASMEFHFRLVSKPMHNGFEVGMNETFEARKREADEFYAGFCPGTIANTDRKIFRQAMAGLLWSKQFYQYDIERWLDGDPNNIPPPDERKIGRNCDWRHVKIADVLAMPDKWEYPWFAAWDLCFHCIPMAIVDPVFAKNQLILLCREWYMSPTGQVPAYEWNFNDVNPPIQAWAALEVFKIERQVHGFADIPFLKRIFQKLMLNFTWWANRKDDNANNVFSGGFLGLDNIGVIDRDMLPPGTSLEQADATAWMAMYALNLMEMALEIAQVDPSYEDAVTKFYEHFVLIAGSLNDNLWDEDDMFFYDRLHNSDGSFTTLKVRSIVGLIVLFSGVIIPKKHLEKLPDFQKRMDFVKHYRTENHKYFPNEQLNDDGDLLISILHKDRLEKLLSVVFDENEFLSVGGIRALSRYHLHHPFTLQVDHMEYTIHYVPGESDNDLFGGNSNWRGPVWIPLNYMIVQILHQRHCFYRESVRVSFPTGSDHTANLEEIATALRERLIDLFRVKDDGKRTVYGDDNWFYQRPGNADLLQFYEYYHGETGEGLGASHQTGWSALIAALIAGVAQH